MGWVEYVSLPAWDIARVRAKMDTGAKTSALHVENIVELGKGRVGFDVVLARGSARCVYVETRITRRGRVRSSNGHYSTRIFVATELALAGIERHVEFSLVDRGAMIHRVLLGRSALDGIFVDVKHRYRQSARRKKAKKVRKAKKAKTGKTGKKARKRRAGEPGSPDSEKKRPKKLVRRRDRRL